MTIAIAYPFFVPIQSISLPEERHRVCELEREDDVGVIDLRPAELLLQRRLQDPDDLPIDVVDRRREEDQATDDPAVVADALAGRCLRGLLCASRGGWIGHRVTQIVGLRR
jgi:hypothetical protein